MQCALNLPVCAPPCAPLHIIVLPSYFSFDVLFKFEIMARKYSVYLNIEGERRRGKERKEKKRYVKTQISPRSSFRSVPFEKEESFLFRSFTVHLNAWVTPYMFYGYFADLTFFQLLHREVI